MQHDPWLGPQSKNCYGACPTDAHVKPLDSC